MGFFESAFPTIQSRLKNWWDHGEQKHPCIVAIQPPADLSLVPDTEDLCQWWTDPSFVIERQMALIDNQKYLGQAVPYHYVDLGASAMAGVLGAEMEYVDKETIWAHPKLSKIDQVLEVQLDRTNSFYRRILEITRRSVALGKDHHFVAPFALGGAGDNVAGLYGTENLLVDLVEDPQRVAEAMAIATQIWLEAFQEITDFIAESDQCGGIGWAGVWAPGTTFPIQEDFSYMISTEMFERFCLPYIRTMAEAMDYAFYHLDGGGALRHLDSILKVDDLKVIQWIPGAGNERLDQWYDLIRYVLSRNRSVQLYAQAEEIDDLVENVGARGLLVIIENPTSEETQRVIDKYRYE